MTVLLHGFWGRPQDWNLVLSKISLEREVLVPDLYEDGPLSPKYSLADWAQNFLSWLDHYADQQPLDLVGYSMGARLAMTAAIARPERFARVLLLAGAPTVAQGTFEERNHWEDAWKEKFASQPWVELESAWQDQPVFNGTQTNSRRQNEELREKLGLSLVNWSPTRHPFNLEHVRALGPQVEWAFGALDQKYLEVAKTLQELPVQGQIKLIPNTGHRLIVDAADFIAAWIEQT